jgi:hypothetical protein
MEGVMPSTHAPSGPVRAGYLLVTFLLVVSAAFGLFVLVSIGSAFARDGESLLYGDSPSVHMQLSPEDVGELPPDIRVDSWLDVTVVIPDPTTRQGVQRSLLDVGPGVLLVGGLWLMRQLLRSVMEDDPFGPGNVRRLRRLGFLLVVGAPLVELVNYSLRLSLYNSMPPHSTLDLGVAGYTIPGAALIGGLGAFILRRSSRTAPG